MRYKGELPTELISKAEFYSKFYELTLSELQTECREKKFVIARQNVMARLYLDFDTYYQKRTGYSVIAGLFNRDHSTCVYSCKQVQNLCDTDRVYRKEWDRFCVYASGYKEINRRDEFHVES